MSQTVSVSDSTAEVSMLFVAFELGWTRWRLAFGSAMGQKAWQVRIPARDVLALSEAITRARKRLGLPCDCPVFSCYEAGREGFWLHRLLQQMSVVNLVVDSSSIEVNRRARRAKTDRLDAEKLLSMLLRYYAGEKRLWSVVRVPTPEQEDGRQLQRAIPNAQEGADSLDQPDQGASGRSGCLGQDWARRVARGSRLDPDLGRLAPA
jgi:transposase